MAEISINIDNSAFDDLELSAEISVKTKYSSILYGFFYRSGRRHTPRNFFDDAFDSLDFERQLAE